MATHPKAEETIILIDQENASKKFKQFQVIPGNHEYHKQIELSPETISFIKKEWKILEDCLPDSIFVRTYEGTIDLLSAVIIGAPGTPHHNGLFFYDIQIPSDYPFSCPKFWFMAPRSSDPFWYLSSRISDPDNLDFYRPIKTEKKKQYSILEILLLQKEKLINSEPKSALGHSNDTLPTYCEFLIEKDYTAFLVSCRLMLGILQEPPRHFEQFVAEHFRECAKSILFACKSYIRDAEHDIVEVVNKDDQCCVPTVVDSTTLAMKEERERCQKSVKRVYYRLFKAFIKNGSTSDSLKSIYNIRDISMEDIEGILPCSTILLMCFICTVEAFLLLGGMALMLSIPFDVKLLGFGLCLIICVMLTMLRCDLLFFYWRYR